MLYKKEVLTFEIFGESDADPQHPLEGGLPDEITLSVLKNIFETFRKVKDGGHTTMKIMCYPGHFDVTLAWDGRVFLFIAYFPGGDGYNLRPGYCWCRNMISDIRCQVPFNSYDVFALGKKALADLFISSSKHFNSLCETLKIIHPD